jgi:hypothetical protein
MIASPFARISADCVGKILAFARAFPSSLLRGEAEADRRSLKNEQAAVVERSNELGVDLIATGQRRSRLLAEQGADSDAGG